MPKTINNWWMLIKNMPLKNEFLKTLFFFTFNQFCLKKIIK